MKRIGEKLILFFVLPFAGFLESFVKPWSSSSRTIIFLWFVVFGMCFTPTNKDADSWRYAEEFKVESRASSAQFHQQISDYFNNYQTTSTKDIYIVAMTFFVSRFTGNPHVFFMMLAFVFAFFYVKSMKFITPVFTEKYEKSVVHLLFLLFCLSNPMFNINGVRFWTAAWISVFVLFQVLVNKKYLYLLLAPATILVHASFVIFVALLGIYFLAGYLDRVWRIIFIISLFFAAFSVVPSFHLTGIPLPVFFESEIEAYASDSAIMEMQSAYQDMPMYAHVVNFLPRFFINVLAVLLLLKEDEIFKNQERKRVMRMMLVLLSFANVTFSIPSVGVRFFRLVFPLLIYLLIKTPSFVNRHKVVVYLFPLAFIVEIVYWFRHMAMVTTITDYITPLPLLMYHYLF